MHQTENWQATDGLQLFAQYWLPKGKPEAVIALVHGMGEHSNRYNHLASFFAAHQVATVTFDHRGHGRSEGKRGHTPSYAQLMADLGLLTGKTKSIVGEDIPIFLYGHSMGGNLVLNYALRQQPALNGVICSSPWLKLAFEPSKFQIWMGKIARQLFPSFSQRSKMDIDLLSHDQQVKKGFEDDQLTHDFVSAEMFFSVRDAGKYALENAAAFPLPLMLFHGTEDHITDPKGSELFVQKAPKTSFKLWEGCYHEIHNEDVKEELFEQIWQWMKGELDFS